MAFETFSEPHMIIVYFPHHILTGQCGYDSDLKFAWKQKRVSVYLAVSRVQISVRQVILAINFDPPYMHKALKFT